MGRLATVAIISLAFAGATVQSFAADAPGSMPPASPSTADAGNAARCPTPAPMPPHMGWMRPMDHGPMDHGPMGMMGHRPEMHALFAHMREMQRNWGLFANQPDKNLSKADVQVLAEAILLKHGNHSWKVAAVADAPDGCVTFAYATADGSVIARFSVDRRTGRFTRIG